MSKELNPLELALLGELQAAHLIISNCLGLMNVEQKTRLAAINEEMEIVEFGGTRFHERVAVIQRANAQVLRKPVATL